VFLFDLVDEKILQPVAIEDLQAMVRSCDHLVPRGGGTKAALSQINGGALILDVSRLSGLLEYNPSEYTFTALAGTRLTDVITALDQHNQYLPFDPLFVAQGGTLGGAVAAGLSGPGRYRYGGLRDFILGVKLVDGNGQLVRGGGKVVKNAAGFDIPKLMVGSLGMFGVLVELTFKVFPKPAAHITIVHQTQSIESALQTLYGIYGARLEIDALDVVPRDSGLQISVRLAGLPEALPARAARVRELLSGGEIYSEEDDARLVLHRGSFQDAETLIKVPLTPKHIPAIESHFNRNPSWQRHYTAGGNVVWLTGSVIPDDLSASLSALKLSGLVVKGKAEHIRIGYRTGQEFEKRIKQVFDPQDRFPIL
jgi:glycolate oxidase FAD binding subunit